MANGTPYGLSASLWTRDLARAHRVAEQLECGTVWVNCWLLRDLRVPFGGDEARGVGREGGEEALRFFTEPKTVCIRYPDRGARNAVTRIEACDSDLEGLYLGNRRVGPRPAGSRRRGSRTSSTAPRSCPTTTRRISVTWC